MVLRIALRAWSTRVPSAAALLSPALERVSEQSACSSSRRATTVLPAASPAACRRSWSSNVYSDYVFGHGASQGDSQQRQESDNEPEWEDPAELQKRRMLDAALKHVGAVGWSDEALARGARDLNLSEAAVGMFPHGSADLVEYFVRRCNDQLAKQLEQRTDELAALRVRDRIKTGVRLRLQMITPYIQQWPQALSIQANPMNAPTFVRLGAEMVDAIWRAAGDNATPTDPNWYSKRGLLAAVYASTELYMLTDFSDGSEETWKFLDRRVEDVMEFGKKARQMSEMAGALGGSLQHVFSSLLPNRPKF
eukprot:jgi/Chlat1/683/Chrsp104S01164